MHPSTLTTSSGRGAAAADDLIAELDGPFWLASSDRELRERVGERAERFLGGGSFLAELREATMLNALLGLALEIEGVELERRELAVSPEFRRVTTTIHLHGGGEEGLGEDVTYQADLHDTFPEPAVAGEWTIASFSESLAGFSFFDTELPDNAANDYRRWALGERRARPRVCARRGRRSRR